eukprot:CAMPEP_0171390744 /NCGR_PEP_ID=MMETSP0880-20121228/778_1 /TAXON_ID=67004 /ORGANISM="Thalassiosira weissflogii, Strain CCMP1336" /LENGTH=297 /DNA_ID=CAMNT_0011903227 /DNA_START=83 /DNA_END=976 /DNA_ORIENTATION=-
MSRSRIYRGITLLATLTATILSPASVAASSSSSSLSSSAARGPIESTGAASPREEVPASATAESSVNENDHGVSGDGWDSNHDLNSRPRRQLSWWEVAIFFVNNHPCPPGPLGHKCHESHSSSSSSSSSSHSSSSSSHSSSSSSSSGSSSSSSSGSSSGYWDADGWHSTSTSASDWAADGYHEESSQLSNSSGNNSAGNAFLSPGSVNFWLMLLVAAASAVAIAAIVVGSRRAEKKEYHPLRGAVGKRMALFGGFADRCLGERALCGAQSGQGGGTEELVEGENGSGGKERGYQEMV